MTCPRCLLMLQKGLPDTDHWIDPDQHRDACHLLTSFLSSDPPVDLGQKKWSRAVSPGKHKENLHHLWVMLPESETVLMTMAALVASFHLSKARTARRYSRRLSLEPESMNPS